MSALNEQPGGNHYKGKAIQPVQYIHANGIGYCEGNVIKYVSRWREKNGLQDLLKARHYIDLLIELEGLEKAEFGQQNTIDCRTDEQRGFNDPRTVEGVDVAFETEKHLYIAPEQCECHRCIEEKGLKVGPLPLSSVKMILCPICGNKRCPKANDHRNECSGSNEPGQPGSAYK